MDFVEMVQVLQPAESAHYRLEHFTVTAQDAELHNLRAAWQGRRGSSIVPGTYVRLVPITSGRFNPADGPIMSDTPFERYTNHYAVTRAHGRVFIAGLGLGMILMPMVNDPAVTHIDVIEKDQEIIDLVLPQLLAYWEKQGGKAYVAAIQNDFLNVIHGDVFDYKPAPGTLYDSIYFDIWPYITSDNLEGMKRLHRSWGRRVNRKANPKAWIASWERNTCEWQARQNKQRGW
jgi:hypothetical protein